MSLGVEANLYRAYAERFPADPAAEFLVTPAGQRITYGDLERESARLATFLSGLGLQPGERITVQCEKSPNVIFLYLACLRAGLVFHPLNPGYTASEVDYFIGDASPAACVFDPRFEANLTPLLKRHGVEHAYTLAADGTGSLTVASAASDSTFATVPRAPDDLAALLYSSGTTGKPKGIMLTQQNLATNARALTSAWGFTSADCLLHVLPIFHVHGLFIALGCALMSGSRMLFAARFEAEETLALLPKATVMMGVPTYYTRLLASPGLSGEACRGIRLFTCGSAPLLADTWHAFEARTGHAILERYGMTETSVITTNPLHDARKPGKVGPALPGVEVRIVDLDGAEVSRGSIGHVEVRSASVFRGYWRLPEKTAQDFTGDGFFRTGDDGVLDDENYLSLIGRAKDLIITGGLNVYPSEVEQVLDECAGVLESAVIGFPHADFGEQVAAVVVLRAGADWDEVALRAAMREKLAAFKCPKQYRVVPELPRNAMGKVQKAMLRAQEAQDAKA
ncbi:MAG: malonyl-CoA synthase [Gammaproteobacteria bacterium]|nr:malonyl-CoA synthase [Gammaproteobacteria bacterium]